MTNGTLLDAARSKKSGSSIIKLENYYNEYNIHLSSFKDQPVRLLEIGVANGGSLYAWQQYFPNAQRIVGVDIKEECKRFSGGNIEVYIGSQEDEKLLRMLNEKEGPFDIIIDDGGHTMTQQKVTFRTLFPLLKDDGLFVIEDLHTSYWPKFGGKLRKRGTMIEVIKTLIDDMHYWAIRNGRASFHKRVYYHFFPNKRKSTARTVFESDIRSITIADSICFIRKGRVRKGEKLEF